MNRKIEYSHARFEERRPKFRVKGRITLYYIRDELPLLVRWIRVINE